MVLSPQPPPSTLTLSREVIDGIVAILREAIEASMAKLNREGFELAA